MHDFQSLAILHPLRDIKPVAKIDISLKAEQAAGALSGEGSKIIEGLGLRVQIGKKTAAVAAPVTVVTVLITDFARAPKSAKMKIRQTSLCSR